MYPTEIPSSLHPEVYEGVEYVRNLAADEREMTKYIIGTISGKDVPRTPQTQGALGRMAYFRGSHCGNVAEGA